MIRNWTEGIHPQAAFEYMRRTGATALPLHWESNLSRWELRQVEVVNWGRDGF